MSYCKIDDARVIRKFSDSLKSKGAVTIILDIQWFGIAESDLITFQKNMVNECEWVSIAPFLESIRIIYTYIMINTFDYGLLQNQIYVLDCIRYFELSIQAWIFSVYCFKKQKRSRAQKKMLKLRKEAYWKVAWCTDYYKLWQLKCSGTHATLHEAKTIPYFVLRRAYDIWSTECQLSSGTRLFPYFSRTALISIDCYTSLQRHIPTLQNEVLFALKASLVFAQQLIL